MPSGEALIAGVEECAEALQAFSDGTDVRTAAGALAIAISTLDDDRELAKTCAVLRGAGVVESLCDLLEDEVAEDALLVLGNLVIDSIDPRASETKRRIHAAGGFSKLLAHLYSSEGMLALYAVGAVMNALYSQEQVQLVQQLGVLPRLQELAGAGETNPELAQYAAGCLHNMRSLMQREDLKPQPAPQEPQLGHLAPPPTNDPWEAVRFQPDDDGGLRLSAPALLAPEPGLPPKTPPAPLALMGPGQVHSKAPASSSVIGGSSVGGGPATTGAQAASLMHSLKLCLETMSASTDTDELASAVSMLSQIQSLTTNQDELKHLGQVLRSHGLVERLCGLLTHESPDVHAQCLLVLGNLAAEAIDAAGAADTKVRMLRCKGYQKLLAHLHSDATLTLLYTCGALMNTSADADCAAIILSESGILPRLQQLADGRIREPTGPGGLRVDGAAINTAPPNEDEVQVAHFARYALTNMREAIVHHQAQKLYNKRVRNLAATEIQAHARRRYAQRRAREIKQMRDDAKARWRSTLVIRRMIKWRKRTQWRKQHSAMVLQLKWRVRLARGLRRRIKFERNRAAKLIQRAYREYQGMDKAAAALQKVARGMLARREMERRYFAAWRLQKAWLKRIRLTNHVSAARIQRCWRAFFLRRSILATKIQRQWRWHAGKRHYDALHLSAALVAQRPKVPKLPKNVNHAMSYATRRYTGEVMPASETSFKIADDLEERQGQGFTPAPKATHPLKAAAKKVMVKSPASVDKKRRTPTKAGIIVLSPRQTYFDPAAWFATTLEDGSDGLREETEMVSLRSTTKSTNLSGTLREDTIENYMTAGGAPSLARSNSLQMSQRTEDSVRREVLSPGRARAVRQNAAAPAAAKPKPKPKTPPRPVSPPAKSGGLFGCFGGGKKKYKVHQDPDMPDMDDNALPLA